MFFNSTTNECDGSFVKVASKDAKEMAQNTLEWVQERRQTSRESAIKREMDNINEGFFHKLFRMKPATREEAVANLQNDIWNFEYHGTHFIGYENEKTANRILNACKHAEEIYISTEDLRRIS